MRVPGDPPCPPEVRLPALRRDHPSAGAIDADAARSRRPGMLAHLLVSKYCDHLPLYRQSEIYARDGLDLDRSTLSDWVGQAVWLLQPIVDGIRSHVFAAEKVHAGDTPVSGAGAWP